jgi:hypothetical protein
MKKSTFKIGIFALAFSAFLSSCKKDDAPKPDEQELITTVKIQLTEEMSSATQTYIYKVENGFGGTGGTIMIDTMKLKPSANYNAVITVLNEKKSPAEDVTKEIIEESDKHLFLLISNPATGNGSVVASNGNKDKAGNPLNQTFKLSTSTAGKGNFQVILLHEPTNKSGTTTATAGGETDLDATFPVVLQ